MLKMGTRAASFSAKIRNLQEYHHRLLNNITPFPSSADIINVLKFFSQALLTILRDIPCLPIDLIRDVSRDAIRIGFFPNLDYRNLYYTLSQMLDSFPQIQSTLQASAPVVFEYLLHALVCLVPFLEHELMDSMPLSVANTISLNFISHQDIIDMLCYNILPFTLYHESHENDLFDFANASIPSIMMTVLSHTDSLSLHSQLLECLMRLKANIIQDLLVVIGYGTGKARHAAVELLFQYWPGLNPSTLDRKTLSEKHVPWKPLTCQNETCQNTLNNEAVKICFAQIEGNPSTNMANLSSDFKGRPSIPLLICIDCAELVREQNSMIKGQRQDVLLNVLHPMSEICYSCESKACQSLTSGAGGATRPAYSQSNATVAVVTCFSTECTSFNCNKPVRLCAHCHKLRHQSISVTTKGGDQQSTNSTKLAQHCHLVQEHLQTLWQLPTDAQQHFAEAVISLLREASILEKSKDNDRSMRTHGAGFGAGGGGGAYSSTSAAGPSGIDPGGLGGSLGATGIGATGGVSATTDTVDSTIEERQLLSRYGIWLLIGMCDPAEATTTERLELLGRMLAMLCQWFHNTACLPDDQAGSALERIKSESIHGWLMKVIKSQFCLFANCLIPNPPEYAQIGGHWETWPSMSIQIKEGFKRLLCLVPYDMITADIWAYIMPFWMESFRYDLAEAELSELKILLSKVLDPDLSPLGLAPKVMYHFISVCFERPMPPEQEQALSWLQILTLLEIPVPIGLLNTMFLAGINTLVGLREELLSKGTEKVYQETDLSEDINLLPGPSTVSVSVSNNELPGQINALTIENLAESQLACYVLMLDILLKQFELQEITAHKGFDTGKDVSNTMELIYEMITKAHCTDAAGAHRCNNQRAGTASKAADTEAQISKPDSILSECFFCDMCSIWYQLSLQLITYFAPLVEVTLIQDMPAADTDTNFYLSALNIDKTSRDGESEVDQSRNTFYSINENNLNPSDTPEKKCTNGAQTETEGQQLENEPINWRDLKIDEEQLLLTIELNMTEKLTLKFLKEIELHNDPDVLYHLLQCLKLLLLHAGILSQMSQDENKKTFFYWCQQRYLVNNLWQLLQAEFSQISQITVPLLLHCIALPGGQSVFSRIIDTEFKHDDWCIRFATIERVASLSQFIEQSVVKNSSSLQSALSSVFTHLIQSLDDINCSVAQRALLSLESMRHASLKLYVWCLEIQFDLVIMDRVLVLSSLLQLFNHLSERRVLTWDFFLNRFDTLFLEAQVILNKSSDTGTVEIGEQPTRDLRNTNVHSETYKKKVKRAHEALAQTHARRSLLRHHRTSFRSETRVQQAIVPVHSTPNQVARVATVHKFQQHTKHGSRGDKFKSVSSSSTMSRKSSKLAALTGSAFPNNFFHESGQSKRDQAQEELQLFNVVHRALEEMECADQETFHLLVFLFMQFLSWSDPQHPTDEKSLNRTQIIVLRHLNTLLGYSMSENSFLLSAYDLRRKPIFSSFLSALPDVLDLNLPVGALLLPTAFPILVYSPAGPRFVYQSDIDSFTPNYSLWLLQPHLRLSWLNTLIVILYKHDYSSVPTSAKFVNHLIQIVINTLESALDHRCSPGDISMRRKKMKETVNTDGEIETKTDSLAGEDTITATAGGSIAKMILTEAEAETHNDLINDPEMTMMMMMMMNDATTDSLASKPIANESEVEDKRPSNAEIELVVAKIIPEQCVKGDVKIFERQGALVSSDDSICSPNKISSTQPDTDTTTEDSNTKQSPVRFPIPTVERLLPIGGELPETVRHSLARRPFPSMICSATPSCANVPVIPMTENCCCCCANTTGAPICCMNYQKTIETFKHSIQEPRDLSQERLLPIGPRPNHSRYPSVTSRSVERNKQNRIGRHTLVRQHTTIGPGHNTNSMLTQRMIPSKSVDSVDQKCSEPVLVTTKIKYEPQPKKYKVESPATPPEYSSGEQTSSVNIPKRNSNFEAKTFGESNESKGILKETSESNADASTLQQANGGKGKCKSTPTSPPSKSFQANLNRNMKDSNESLNKTSKDKTKKNRKKSKKISKLATVNMTAAMVEDTESEPITATSITVETTPPATEAKVEPETVTTDCIGKPTNSTNTGRSNDSSHSDQSINQFELCPHCRLPVELFDEHELGLCLVVLATFVHRDTYLAASVLPQILSLTARYALRCVYPWQMESNIHLPGNNSSIARQFIRCTLHQLNSNGIFRQLFQTHFADVILFRSIAISLADFVELNQVTPLKQLFEALVEDKQLPPLSQQLHILSNVATYFECVFVDYNVTQSTSFNSTYIPSLLSNSYGTTAPVMGAGIVANQPWSDLMSSFEAYLRRLTIGLTDIASSIHNLVPLMRVLLAMFKIPGIGAHRSILDPVNKLLIHVIQHSPLLLEHVRELCILCARAYVRDRDRLCIARTFSLELVQALRFRTQLPDENILLLVQWALEDAGGTLSYSITAQSLERSQNKQLGQSGVSIELTSTNATECLRLHISELLDFISDVHALTRFKSNFQGTSVHLNEETIGGQLKAGIAQFLALELTRSGGSDHRAVTKYLPWLYTLPSLQQGPKEFLECISHIRLLSWILLGSLQHTALMKCHPSHSNCLVSQPIPLEASTHIAEHVQAILAGFAEQSKASVLHMSALFYAFLLCQLWTVYCEQLAGQSPPGSDAAHQNILVLSDFWSKVTPGVLQLICHSKAEGLQQLSDTISLHFLSLMETLMECNSEILARLIPLWLPLFNSYQGQLSGNIRVRLQTIVSWPCPPQTRDDAMMISTILIRWLQRIQAKMSQIEMQSSTAIQFYCI